MKRTAIILLLMISILLPACAPTGSAPPGQSANTQPKERQTSTVVYEDAVLKATFRGVSSVAGQIGMAFTLENKSSHEITVLPMDSSVNDVMVLFTSGMLAAIQPGKAMNQVWMANPDVVGVKADGVKNIELSLNYDNVTTKAIKITL